MNAVTDSSKQMHFLRDITNSHSKSAITSTTSRGISCSTCTTPVRSHSSNANKSATVHEANRWVPKSAIELIEGIRSRASVKLSPLEAEELLFGMNLIWSDLHAQR